MSRLNIILSFLVLTLLYTLSITVLILTLDQPHTLIPQCRITEVPRKTNTAAVVNITTNKAKVTTPRNKAIPNRNKATIHQR